MSSDNKKPLCKTLLNAFTIYIVILLPVILVNSIPTFKKDGRRSNPVQKCFSNIIVLQGAFEMYNMDNEVMINEMNDEVIDKLLKGGYLKSAIVPVEPGKCKYLGEDLTKNGVIYCKYHGAPDGKIDCEYKREREQHEKEKHLKEIKEQVGILGLCAVPSVIYILLSL